MKFCSLNYFLKKREDTWPTERAMRWIIFNREFNGAKRFLRKVSGRWFIDEVEFENWINEDGNDK